MAHAPGLVFRIKTISFETISMNSICISPSSLGIRSVLSTALIVDHTRTAVDYNLLPKLSQITFFLKQFYTTYNIYENYRLKISRVQKLVCCPFE